jgi:hypothetical protein
MAKNIRELSNEIIKKMKNPLIEEEAPFLDNAGERISEEIGQEHRKKSRKMVGEYFAGSHNIESDSIKSDNEMIDEYGLEQYGIKKKPELTSKKMTKPWSKAKYEERSYDLGKKRQRNKSIGITKTQSKYVSDKSRSNDDRYKIEDF